MNVLFIDIDTLRPDHMGCYGYPRNTTPCLDRVRGRACGSTGVIARTRPACPLGRP